MHQWWIINPYTSRHYRRSLALPQSCPEENWGSESSSSSCNANIDSRPSTTSAIVVLEGQIKMRKRLKCRRSQPKDAIFLLKKTPLFFYSRIDKISAKVEPSKVYNKRKQLIFLNLTFMVLINFQASFSPLSLSSHLNMM